MKEKFLNYEGLKELVRKIKQIIPTKTSQIVNDSGYITTDTNTTYTLSQDSDDRHKITLTPSEGAATTITIPDNNTTYNPATTTEDGLMSSSDKEKLDGISNGAEQNVQSDWSETDESSDSFIKNKPNIQSVNDGKLTIQKNSETIDTFTANASTDVTVDITVPTKTSDLDNDSGFVTEDTTYTLTQDSEDGHKLVFTPSNGESTTITIPDEDTTYSPATKTTDGLMSSSDKSKLDTISSYAEQNVQSNWDETNSSSDAYILNKPTIPTVNDSILTIKKNGETVSTFTANSATDVTANITVPTKNSELENDSKYITGEDVPTKVSQLTNDTGFITAEQDKNTTYTLTQDKTDGHKITLTPSDGESTTITIPDKDTTYSVATATTDGLLSNQDKIKLDGIAAGANVNVQSDWENADTTSDAYIKNKPTIPIVNDAKLTIQRNSQEVGTFTANSSTDATININVPVKVSDLTNDAGYITEDKNTTYTLEQDKEDGHKLTFTPSDGTATVITIPDNNTTYNPATETTDGLLSATDKKKLDTISENAEQNVQSNWDETDTTSDSFIQNKPTIGSGTLKIQKNGTDLDSFNANATTDTTVNIDVPTKVSELTNDSGFITTGDIPTKTSQLVNDSGFITEDTNTTYTLTQDSTDGHKLTFAGSDGSSKTVTIPDKDTTYSDATTTVAGLMSATDKTKLDDTYSKEEVNKLVSEIPKFAILVVDALPTKDISSTTIYLLKESESETGNLYTEYIYVNNAWEKLGTQTIDLSDYAKKTDLPTVNDATLTIKQNGESIGTFTANQSTATTIELAGEDNVQSDWSVTDTESDAYIKNKPTIPTVGTGVLTIQKNGTNVTTFSANATKATTANITVPTKTSELTNDSDFITSSSLPTVNNGTLTVQKNGTDIGSFTANQSTDSTINVTVPTKVSELTNDSGYKTTDNNTTYTLTQDSTDGHKITLTPSTGSATTITIPDNNTTYSNATTSAAGLMSSSDKTKLNGIATGAEVNVQSDWSVTDSTSDAYIANKPTIPTVNDAVLTITQNGTSKGTFSANASSAKTIALTDTTYSNATTSAAGLMSSTDKTKLDGVATGAEVNVQADWSVTDTTSDAYIANKPTIPTVNNATLTIQKNGSTVKTFTANASTNVTANITVPVKVSELTNDSGFVTTDTKVTQTETSTDAYYEILLAGSTSSSTTTEGANKSSTLKYDPQNKAFNINTVLYQTGSAKGWTSTYCQIPAVRAADGVMEIGKYIDFHDTADSTVDYTVRLQATTDGLNISKHAYTNLGYDVLGDNTAVNMVNFLTGDAMSKTQNGITTTCNSTTGIFTATGTATAQYWHTFSRNITLKANKKYAFSSGVSTGSSSTYYIYIYDDVNKLSLGNCTGNAITFTPTKDTTNASITFTALKDASLSNVSFKPMLEVGNTAHTFLPYTGPYDRINEDIANGAIKLATARKINGVSFDGTADIVVPDSQIPIVREGNSSSGKRGIINFLTITIKGNYANAPVIIRCINRSDTFDIYLKFTNQSTAAATVVDKIEYRNLFGGGAAHNIQYTMVSGVLNLFYEKEESYGAISVSSIDSQYAETYLVFSYPDTYYSAWTDITDTLTVVNAGTDIKASTNITIDSDNNISSPNITVNTATGTGSVVNSITASGHSITPAKVNLSTVINNDLSTGTSTPTDNDYYIAQYVGGGTTNTNYYRRPVSALWSYIKSKIDAVPYKTMLRGTILTNNTDLNDLTTAGVYYSSANAMTQTLLNTPGNMFGNARIEVFMNSGGGTDGQYLMQIYYQNSPQTMTSYIRSKGSTDNGWSPWHLQNGLDYSKFSDSTSATGQYFCLASHPVEATNYIDGEMTFLVSTEIGIGTSVGTNKSCGILHLGYRSATTTAAMGILLQWELAGSEIVLDEWFATYSATNAQIKLWKKSSKQYEAYTVRLLSDGTRGSITSNNNNTTMYFEKLFVADTYTASDYDMVVTSTLMSTKNTALKAGSNITIADDGTIASTTITRSNSTSGTKYLLTSGSYTKTDGAAAYGSVNFKAIETAGTTTVNGASYIQLGNTTAVGTAGNSYGQIRFLSNMNDLTTVYCPIIIQDGLYTSYPIRTMRGSAYGCALLLGTGGLTVVGGGESAASYMSLTVDTTNTNDTGSTRRFKNEDEYLLLMADSEVRIYAGCNSIDSRKMATLLSASGFTTFPGPVSANTLYHPFTIPVSPATASPYVPYYVKLGTVTINSDAHVEDIIIYAGDGYNGNPYQQDKIVVSIKDSYQSAATDSPAGVIIRYFRAQNLKSVSTSSYTFKFFYTQTKNTCVLDVYMRCPYQYSAGCFRVEGRGGGTNAFVYDGTASMTEPTADTTGKTLLKDACIQYVYDAPQQYANGYYGITAGNNASAWVRTTVNGFIPYSEVSLANGGTGSLGTSTWAFKNAYIANLRGTTLYLGSSSLNSTQLSSLTSLVSEHTWTNLTIDADNVTSGTIQAKVVGETIYIKGTNVKLAAKMPITQSYPFSLASTTDFDFSQYIAEGFVCFGAGGTYPAQLQATQYSSDNIISAFAIGTAIPSGTSCYSFMLVGGKI